MKYLQILILMTFVACSSAPIPNNLKKHGERMIADEDRVSTDNDIEFKVYVEHFRKLKSAVDKYYHPSDVVVVFGPEFKEEYLSITSAACVFYTNNKREIRINENKWNELGKNQKEFTIYHYLVHCDLDYHTHNSQKNNKGLPVSTMSKYIVNEHVLKQNRAYYIRDIFKNY